MKKRGMSDHLDWVIGVAIFLGYIVLVMTLLKPISKPLYDDDVLLNIVEDNLVEDVSWILYRVPAQIESHGEFSDCGEFPFIGWENSNTKMLSNTGGDKIFDITGFKFMASIAQEVRNYTFLYGKELSGNGSSITCPSTGCDLGCGAYYGIPEVLVGFSEDKLNDLYNIDYQTTKNDWNFPNAKDFNINAGGAIIGSTQEVPATSPIKVRQVTHFILTDKGELEPIKIIIKIW